MFGTSTKRDVYSVTPCMQAPLTQMPDDLAKEESVFAKCIANGEAGKAVVSLSFTVSPCSGSCMS